MLPMQNTQITARGVRGLILAALDTGDNSWVSRVSMRMSSDQAIETYAWLGTSPEMREFIAGRQPAELKENSFQIANKDYETSLKIKLKDMRRDKLGMIQMRVNQLADRVNDHPAKLLSALMIAGESQTCYDGQYFFDTDHADGDSGTLSNKISVSDVSAATVSTVDGADSMAKAIMQGIQTMYGFKDDRGAPMNQSARSFGVMVPPTMMGAALTAITGTLGTGGKSAALPALASNFSIDVIPNARLSSWTSKFAIFRTDEAARPFILQEEGTPDVMALGEGSEYTQINKECMFGVDWSGNVGYAWWQHACLVQLTG